MTPTFSQRGILRSLAGIHPASFEAIRRRAGIRPESLRSELRELVSLGAVSRENSKQGKDCQFSLTLRGLAWSMSEIPNPHLGRWA